MKFSLPHILFLLILNISVNAQGITVTANTTGSIVPIHDFLGLNSQDINKPGLGFDNPTIIDDLRLVNPSTLRFPGGTVANWWDWENGNYIDPINPATSCYGLPIEFGATNPQNSNTLANFKKALEKTGAQPIWVLNLLSSSLSSQLSMLGEAELLGMPIEYVELGNEFYLENDCSIEKYADGLTYGHDVSVWTQAVKARFPFAKVSCVGASLVSATASPRLSNWNTQLQNYLKGAGITKPDAFIIHDYKTANLVALNSTPCNFIDQQNPNCATPYPYWSYFFGKAFRNYQNIQAYVYPQINPSGAANTYKYWFTEYNLLERNFRVHGTWAHALHTGLMTLLFLQDADKIEHINCHALIGQGIFGSIFNKNSGFVYGSGVDAFCSPTCTSLVSATKPNTLTSLGLVMSEIGKAMKNAVDVQKVSFTVNAGILPLLHYTCSIPNFESLIGYKFKDVNGNEQLILLNLSDRSINL